MVVDDHELFRAGIRLMVERWQGMQVVAEAASRSDAIAASAREAIDVIILDLDLGAESGLDALPEITANARNARVIGLTGMRDVEHHRQALLLGALGLVFKEQAADHLRKAIEKVYAGEAWLDRATMASVLTDISRRREVVSRDPEVEKIDSLTQREREVITLIGEGLHNREIGQRLSISDTTVRHHLTSVFAKLNLTNRLELVIYAYRYGIIKLPQR